MLGRYYPAEKNSPMSLGGKIHVLEQQAMKPEVLKMLWYYF